MKIDKLTAEQEAKVPLYLKKWLDNGRKTTKIDQTKAKQAIIDIHTCAGVKPPEYFFFFPSPIQCQLAANLMKSKDFNEILKLGNNLRSNLENNLRNNLWNNLRSNLRNNLWNNLRNNLENNLENNLRSNLENNLRNNLWNNLENNLWNNLWNNLRSNLENNFENIELEYQNLFWSNHWVGWAGFYDYILNELFESKISEYSSFIKYLDALQQVHLFITYENIVFISDNPETITLDSAGRLHGETAPAMMYDDGYSLFYINGVQVPKWAIETPKEDIKPQQILELTNTEQRAVLMRHVGLTKFLKELKAEQIHAHEGYKLYYIEYEGNKLGPYLYMKCPSSGREFLEGCGDPAGDNFIDPKIKTCQDALKWRSLKASKNLMTKFNLKWEYSA